MKLFLACFFFVVLTGEAVSAPSQRLQTELVTARTKSDFETQALAVRKGMEPQGRYEFVTDPERKTVERRLAEIEDIFAHYVEGTALRDAALVGLLNAQKEINGILQKRDGERLVCTNSIATGTHRAVSNCKRYSDIERTRRDSQKVMRDYLAVPHDARDNCASGKCQH